MNGQDEFDNIMHCIEAAEIQARLEACSENLKMCLKNIDIGNLGGRSPIVTEDVRHNIVIIKQGLDATIKIILKGQNRECSALARSCKVDDFYGFCTTEEGAGAISDVADAAIKALDSMAKDLNKVADKAVKDMEEKKQKELQEGE